MIQVTVLSYLGILGMPADALKGYDLRNNDLAV